LILALRVSAWHREDLSERSFEFTCDVYDYCEDLLAVGGLARRLAYQLWDAASSVGANRAEARSSYSGKEFAVKNAICLKECREARFWLSVAERKSLGNPTRRKCLLQESNELVSIYVTSVRKLQARANKTP
jgi:four helix bundle protein